MARYFDSSVLLSILLEEEMKNEAAEIWKADSIRLSSILLPAESYTVLRRYYAAYKSKLPSNWLPEKEKNLRALLEEITLGVLDHRLIEIIAAKKELARCRTLDAIHLATAIGFREKIHPERLTLCTFDQTMKRVAKRLKFKVLPDIRSIK